MYKLLPLAVAVLVFPVIREQGFSVPGTPSGGPSFSIPCSSKLPDCFYPSAGKDKGAAYSQDWLSSAEENIRKAEYRFGWEEKKRVYCTPNRKNNLRFFYSDNGFSAEPRVTKIPVGWIDKILGLEKTKYKTIPGWKINFRLDKRQVGKGRWQVNNDRASYVTRNITVQYHNAEEGMRQNFIVHSPLTKNGTLRINFSVDTRLRTYLQKDGLQFFRKKTNVLNYDKLMVWDADHKMLEASIKREKGNRFYILVNTKDAVYPVTVDPLSSTPSPLLESNQTGATFGRSVTSAGDVNGDGYSDVVVGADGYDGGHTDEGAVFVFMGSASGLSGTPAALMTSGQDLAREGACVSSAGDVNGDGYSDIIAGAYIFHNGETGEGAAFIYHGSAGGINPVPVVIIESNQVNANFGRSVACAGDVNGDGYSDVIIGAPGYTNGQAGEGAVFIYQGSSSGISSVAALVIEPDQVNAVMGFSVASAGDVNGDGYSDIIAGAHQYDSGETDEGVAFVYLGSSTGIHLPANTFLEANLAFSKFGFSVSCAGDVNGDGYSDVVVGAPSYYDPEGAEGAAFVYYGSSSGVVPVPVSVLESNMTNAQEGIAVAGAGDINGDGYADLIIGAHGYSNGQSSEGAVYVYYGSPVGVASFPAVILESDKANAQFGRAVGSAGDVNGDGYSDIIAGAYNYANPQVGEGAAFVYQGSANGISSIPSAFAQSDQAFSGMGISVASAGDVNADGFSDVIAGAYLYDNGQADEGAAFVYLGSSSGLNTIAATTLDINQADAQFGFSVANAGDVNGDGYSDLIVGAPKYDLFQTDQGAAFVYYGSIAGIINSPGATLTFVQLDAYFGSAVSSAGDINGDGYSDVLVGAPFYDDGAQTNEGAAFVYLGYTTGINTSPMAIAEGNQAGAYMGNAVAAAGDVNGDGFGDFMIAAYFYYSGGVNDGSVFLYHGSNSGINFTPAATVRSYQANSQMGVSVSSAGDVNGDGYSDIIAGCQYYDNGVPLEGAAFIFLGSASGLNITPAVILSCGGFLSKFGGSVSCAGDINGDGYSDVVVGASGYTNGEANEGAFFVYHGSPTGISFTPDYIIESNQAGGALGRAVSTAGDINGDGYSDVMAGATDYDLGQTNEGVSFAYYGDSSVLNRRNNLRLYNKDLVTPLSSSNFIFANFGAGLFARSFIGRTKAKMVWETRINYNAYSGNPITNSTLFTAQQTNYADLGTTGIELKSLIDKILGSNLYTKLRARVKFDPATAITGQVYGPWRNASAVIDGNSLGALPVHLVSFTASWIQKGSSARIDFSTDKESGVCCFDIEKSIDGIHFSSIGTLPAKNSPGIQQYSFTDHSANGRKQFYRLQVKGMNGQAEYSNVQQLRYDGATEIILFPNPVTEVLQLRLNSSCDKVNIRLINAAGMLVRQFSDLPAASQTVVIPVKEFSSGVYWLQIQAGSAKQTLQFVKK